MKELRPYQQEDVDFLSSFYCAACFNEQRTGKTPTILAVLKKRKLRKALIVCPASATYPWKDAFEYWNDKPCVVIAGTAKQQRKAMQDWTYGAVISYDLLKLVQRKGKTTGLLFEILACKPEVVVADEAHRFRNPGTKVAEAIFKLASVQNRYALTGTPVLDRAHEIYSILHWLFPETYRGAWPFYHKFFHVHELSMEDRSFQQIGTFKPLMKEVLQKVLLEFSTQRKRKDVMPWLPEKDYQPIRLPPTELQKKYIQEMMEVFETGHVIAEGVLDQLLRVRQICLSPALIGLPGHSPKIEWMIQFLLDYPDTPVLIFSKFTSWLKLLHIRLFEGTAGKNIGVIFGDTPKKQRAAYISDFQNGRLNVMLINIDAGKEALTLDRAEAIIFTDKFPPVGDIQQAEDRFVSTTIDKANKPHTIYELMMAGTYEEHMYKLLASRAAEIDIINDYRRYLNGHIAHIQTSQT